MSHVSTDSWLDTVRERLDGLERVMPPANFRGVKEYASECIQNGDWEALDTELDAMCDYWLGGDDD